MRDTAAYLGQIRALLPRGAAWQLRPGSIGEGVQVAFADELARVDARAVRLTDEADPFTALELLPDWERAVGLPDPCTGIAESTRERQLAVARKLAGVGGQSRAYFIEEAGRLGVEVEIVEHRPMVAGDRCGRPTYGEAWRFAFTVRLLPASERTFASSTQIQLALFRAGLGRAGDPLRSFSVQSLECVVERAKPAHTEVLFAYPVDPEPALWFDFVP